MSKNEKIITVAVVKKKLDDRYELVARWFLGEEYRLPKPNDEFRVRVSLIKSNRFLKADGTFGQPGDDHFISVKPKSEIMLDAPRKAVDIPGGFPCKDQWYAVTTPTKPVNCASDLNPTYKITAKTLACLKAEQVPAAVIEMLKVITNEFSDIEAFKAQVRKVIGDENAQAYVDLILRHAIVPSDEGFGVCHLLSEVQHSRVQWRVGRKLFPRIDETIKQQRLMGRSLKFIGPMLGGDEAEAIAQNLASFLVRGGPRVADLPSYLLRTYRELQVETSRHDPKNPRTPRAPEARDIFSFGSDGLATRWEYAALIIEVLKDEKLRESLDRMIEEPEKVRQHLRLRGTQGGRLIDYWCTPSMAGECVGDESRGRQYPASEILGLGLTIGTFTRADVQSWIDEANTAGARLKIEVSYVEKPKPAPPLLREAVKGQLSDIFDEDSGDGPLIPLPFYIEDKQLNAMLNVPTSFGSTAPPQRPSESFVNYDLIQTNAGITDAEAEQVGRQLGYKTGDGRIELLLKATPEPEKELTRAVGFNIYGMWEEASTQAYFDNPAKTPTLSELRPWMITRRYSYERDLKGAFPGRPLDTILANPPWQALLEITSDDKWVDEEAKSRLIGAGLDEDTKAADLPNKINPGYTMFTLDLRAGMDSGYDGATRKFVGWDTRGAVKSNWDLEQKRDNTPAGPTPQRYRFWVTTVDCFEQESDPLPVRTNDLDAGEKTNNFLYAPQRRAALLAPEDSEPPAAPGISNKGRGIYLQPDKLTVYWQTPYLNETGKFNLVDEATGQTGTPLKRANKTDLFGTVVIYRRRLRHRIAPAERKARLTSLKFDLDGSVKMAGENILALPQWTEEINRLENDSTGRWKRFAQKLDVGPSASDTWTSEFSLTHADRGYDYVAVLSVAVRPEKMNFWTANAVVSGATPGRRVQLVKRKDQDSDYTLDIARISETPAVSDAVCTRAVSLPNVEPPRGVQMKPRLDFYRAQPIPAPPGVARDAVLLKLLKHAFKDGDKPAPLVPWHAPWPEPDESSVMMLTQGQAEMIENALERTTIRVGWLAENNKISDPSLSVARWILASDFVGIAKDPSAPTAYRQHQSIGFRGLQELNFSYKPFELFPPAPNESEAVGFRIYSMRVPLNPISAANFATFRLDNCEQLGSKTYKLRVPKAAEIDDDPFKAIRPIELNHQPALARITPLKSGKPDEKNSTFGVIAGLKRVGDFLEAEFAFSENEVDLQPRANISLFMGQPIYSVTSKQFESGAPDPTEIEQYRILMPVGGGHPEVFCWWVSSVSAQEIETDHSPARRPFVILKLDYGTIEPTTPRMLRLSAPMNRVEHSLDPVKFKDWLPEQALNPAAALDSPRLIISWEPYDITEPVFIAVERDQVRAAPDDARFSLKAEDLKPWLAIKAIEAAKEDEPLQVEWLKNIRRNWLLGQTVKEPDTIEQDDHSHIAVTRSPRMTGQEGLKLIHPDPSSTEQRPAFIDYFRFRLPENRILRMDANWLYRYRLIAYIDLGDAIPDPDWRYLKSKSTDWTELRLPETTPINVEVGQTTTAPALLGPEVEFNLKTAAASLANLLSEASEEDWRYRVLIRRKRNFSIRSAPNAVTDSGWEEVGTWVSLWPVPGQNQTVFDLNVERADIDRPAEFTYQVSINEFVSSKAESSDEILIRSQGKPTEFKVTIPPPAEPFDKEVRVVVPIEIG